MDIHFILVEPIVPQNVGAAARAIKTMGFHNLRLVNPCDYLCDHAKWLAHGSVEILNKARVFGSLAEAIEGLDLVIGATAKHRAGKHSLFSGQEAVDLVRSKKAALGSVGIVFGREDNGLRNSELDACDILTWIPMKTKFPSLNLGQAVMLYAYLFFPFAVGEVPAKPEKTDQSAYPVLKKKVTSLLEKIGQPRSARIHGKIMERLAILKHRDLRLLHFICERLEEKLQ